MLLVVAVDKLALVGRPHVEPSTVGAHAVLGAVEVPLHKVFNLDFV